MVDVVLLGDVDPELIGMIPFFLDEQDPRPAREQFDEKYAHGGGWRPFEGFKLQRDHTLKYSGDPPMRPLAMMKLRDEVIVVYQHAWVMILQPGGTYEIARMD